MRLRLIAAAMLLLVPVAVAGEVVHLRMTSEDGIRASATHASARIGAAYTEQPDPLRILCNSLTVTTYVYEAAVVPTFEFPTKRSSTRYHLSDAEGTFTARSARSWLGVYPPERPLRMMVDGASDIRANASADVGNARSTPESTPQHDQPSFGVRVNEPVLLIEPASPAKLNGSWSVKFSGALLEIHARENTTRIDTRESTAQGAPAQIVRRWAVLECQPGGVIEGWTGPFLGLGWTSAEVSGLAGHARDLRIETDGDARRLTDQTTWFEGDFMASIFPTVTAGVAELDVTLSGQVRSPLLPNERPIFTQVGPWGAWLIAATAGIAIGATLVVARARRRFGPHLGIDELVQLADQAASEQRFAVALEWQERALRLAPQHPRLLVDAGYFLSELGRVDEAVLMLTKAAERGSDGEAELVLARLLAKTGGDLREQKRCMVASIEKDPWNLIEIESDEKLSQLLEDDALSPTVRHARRTLDDV